MVSFACQRNLFQGVGAVKTTAIKKQRRRTVVFFVLFASYLLQLLHKNMFRVFTMERLATIFVCACSKLFALLPFFVS